MDCGDSIVASLKQLVHILLNKRLRFCKRKKLLSNDDEELQKYSSRKNDQFTASAEISTCAVTEYNPPLETLSDED